MKNLCIGSAFSYEFDIIKNFVLSYIEHHPEDTLLLFIDNRTSLNTLMTLDNLKVKYCYFNTWKYINSHINCSRFFAYLDFLMNSFEFDNILLSDTRDVVFQGNIFNGQSGEYLYMFIEDHSVKISDDKQHNDRWLNDVYGTKLANTFNHNPIICAGTTLGSSKNIIKYLELMCLEFYNLKRRSPNLFEKNYDQGIHNFIGYKCHESFEGFQIKSNGDIVATVGLTAGKSPGSLSVSVDNIILLNGCIPSLVHQYDRVDELEQSVRRRFQTF
jgi:hypothetical protein